MTRKRAADLQKGDCFVFRDGVERDCLVQGVRFVPIADLLPEDCAPYAREGELVELAIAARPGFRNPAFPGVLFTIWTLHLDPEDTVSITA